MYRQLYQCPLGLELHFYGWSSMEHRSLCRVSMPSRAEAPFLQVINVFVYDSGEIVSIPSRASTPFLQYSEMLLAPGKMYQCPLGLMLHFYLKRTTMM